METIKKEISAEFPFESKYINDEKKSVPIWLGDLPAGVYLLRVKTNKKTYSREVIKK